MSVAPKTSMGAEPPSGVASEKRLPHGEPSPATPPEELTHVARISASVLIWDDEALDPPGKAGPGVVPVAVFTYSFTRAKAVASCAASLDPDPSWLIEDT